ncbi:hypothetical protein [Streptomyces tendae]|uniref:hypothetical protein n=1 Tax=Streptomyces tendae TaxID=1932 RepID=UPI0033EF6EDB
MVIAVGAAETPPAEADQRRDERGKPELGGSQDGRSGLGGLRCRIQRDGGGRAEDESQRGEREEEWHGQPGRTHRPQGQDAQRQRGGDESGDTCGKDAVRLGAVEQPRGLRAAGDQAACVDREEQAVADRADSDDRLLRKRRRGCIGHQHGEGGDQRRGRREV